MKGDSMSNETTKQKILTQALKLFSQYGYEAVSVEQIATAVGIKAPSLYKHYKSKQDIFDSILARMNEMDLERARRYAMPQENTDEAAAAYQQAPLEKIKAYSSALFLHWTEEEFSSDFRKMLTLEQYQNPEMSQLYQKYLATEPVQYMAQVFRPLSGSDAEAMQIALEFYGPIYLLYSLYDGTQDKAAMVSALQQHIERFSSQLGSSEPQDYKE
jgi:AcrR family transcriptional regulator